MSPNELTRLAIISCGFMVGYCAGISLLLLLGGVAGLCFFNLALISLTFSQMAGSISFQIAAGMPNLSLKVLALKTLYVASSPLSSTIVVKILAVSSKPITGLFGSRTVINSVGDFFVLAL